MGTSLKDELIEQILMKVRSGAMTAEEGQAAIKRLIEEAGAEASGTAEDSPAEQRIRSAARRARLSA
jgi:hypothetical protein